jgi:hypothetical protein
MKWYFGLIQTIWHRKKGSTLSRWTIINQDVLSFPTFFAIMRILIRTKLNLLKDTQKVKQFKLFILSQYLLPFIPVPLKSPGIVESENF